MTSKPGPASSRACSGVVAVRVAPASSAMAAFSSLTSIESTSLAPWSSAHWMANSPMGPAADHGHPVARAQLGAPDGVQGDGGGVEHRGGPRVEIGGQHQQIVLGHGHVLGVGPG